MTEPLALYIHWPFCAAKCPYCDFNSHVREAGVDHARFRAALRRELAFEAGRAGRRPLASIFFGGGTPSLMEPETVAALIADAGTLFDMAPDIEITLEANPTSVEIGKLREFRAAGVNRASLGVQSLDAEALRFLGRRHDAGEAITALEAAREIFPRLSFDLIYARPGQAEAAWRAELRQALALAADHLSLYQLTIEPGTRFATQYARGDFALPAEDDAARMYEATAEEARRFGLVPYEVSNYAKPGAESRHNLAYWRYGDYLGIGPGAHQRMLRRAAPAIHASGDGGVMLATRRHRAPEEWAARVEQSGHAIVEEEELSPRDRGREALLMGLRLAEGVDPARIEARSGLRFVDTVDPAMLSACLEEGYLEWQGPRLVATSEGRVRLDALLPALLR
ncbi:radical SAM family heme chaperone HemW [Sediminicoccus sp. KRV36]|uniref:radical SAM family heme chaperone HemW n=1 Tax=Sediminicoccus sp. KRV36 TaxID=3133721 RepID=UPI00200C91CB|nr:radical SAM family heme chaperone HemW [Sediminicoccus rosea]UPY37551.1 radical SAM family heme chaperone HemW [Sediminicoccus rosea]